MIFVKYSTKSVLHKVVPRLLNRYLSSKVQLTSLTFPKIERKYFSKIDDSHLSFFEKLLPGRVLTDSHDVLSYNIDWMLKFRGISNVVLQPKCTAEVASILSYCNEKNIAISVQGGNTGLVGGSVPVFDEVVLSMSLMKKIISFDEYSGVLTCEAGCVLQTLDNFVAEYGFLMPLDLGSKGSCQIGGNISTNAGGLRLMRYGSLLGNVLGLEVVLPNGDLMSCLSSLRKDNTGYHLPQIFVGAEGTLGVVCAVSLHCPPRPLSKEVCLLGLANYEHVLELFVSARKEVGEALSAFEFMDTEAMSLVCSRLNLANPIGDCPFYVVLETSTAVAGPSSDLLHNFLSRGFDSGILLDGCVASSEDQAQHIWNLRERITESTLHDGHCYKYDISLPLPELYECVRFIRDRVAGSGVISCLGYGHVGDGNLHLNFTSKKFDPAIKALVEPDIFEWVSDRKGSVSAEHGIGLEKSNFLKYSKNEGAISLMRKLKNSWDVNGILNPYKTLPSV